MSEQALKICNTCGRKYMKPEDFLRNTTRWRICDRKNLWFNCECQSTNMIIKGKFDWYSPEMSLSEEGKSIFNKIPSLKELPHVPSYVMELQQLIQKESTSSRQLATVAKKAPILASNILKIANNQCGARGAQIESLEHAISYVGMKSLKDMILIAALNTFKFSCQVFDSKNFWESSFITGRISEQLARKFCPDVVPDEAYIAGTLCNVGKIVLAITEPEIADKISRDMQNVKILGNWIDGEKRHGAFDHCILGEIGAVFWGFPDYVIDVIATHHKMPQSFIESSINIKDLVSFSNQLTHWVQLAPHQMDERILEAHYEKFSLSPAQVERMVEELMPLKNVA